jgi:hypothetical protein
VDIELGTIKRDEINGFLADHGIYHAKEVTFSESSYTVKSFRRNDEGKYILSQEHPGRPIEDVEVFMYGN